MGAREAIPGHQCILCVQLIVDSGGKRKAILGRHYCHAERSNAERWRERNGIDNGVALYGLPAEIGKKSRLVTIERPSQVPAKKPGTVRRLVRGERVPGVQDCIRGAKGALAMEFLRPRLRQDFNQTKTQLRVLGRERIITDADLSNRVSQRQWIVSETIDQNLRSKRTRSAKRQGAQNGFQ